MCFYGKISETVSITFGTQKTIPGKKIIVNVRITTMMKPELCRVFINTRN